MTQTRVAVLRGGPSSEYDVSMTTGAGVLKALRARNYFVKDVVITKNLEWLIDGFVRRPEQVVADVDVVFIALHGAYGEDGTVQRLLERLRVPYTGSGPMASGIAMRKGLTKATLQKHGLKMPKHMRVTRASMGDVPRLAHTIASLFGPEYFIKPECGGSSINTMFITSPHDLPNAIMKALTHDDSILVEERITGKEATVGILEHFRETPLYVLPEIEIVPPAKSGFFAADVKYDGSTAEICPGNFSSAEKARLREAATLVHQAIGLSHYSRSDFIVKNGDVYFLEVNTLPGLTSESLFPKSMAAVGSTYDDLVGHLVELARNTRRA